MPPSKSLFIKPFAKSIFSKTDHEIWPNFYKLQSLVDQLQITIEKAYIQYQLEILSIATSYTVPPNTSITTYVVVNPPLPPLTSSSPSTQPIVVPIQLPPAVMENFAPLVLPGQLVALPQNYGQRLPLFYGNSEITTRQNVDKLVDFIDIENVDDEDAKMRIIKPIFSGDVKK